MIGFPLLFRTHLAWRYNLVQRGTLAEYLESEPVPLCSPSDFVPGMLIVAKLLGGTGHS